jgi:hypothetical protein
MELREFFARLTYRQISEFAGAEDAHGDPRRAAQERMDNIKEAAIAMPAVEEAYKAVLHAQRAANDEATAFLKGQCHLLGAIYRIAQDMGYQW